MQRVTMREIARKAGVSTATVSLILRGEEKGRASKETVTKILGLARELNYHPDPALQALVAYRNTKRKKHRFRKMGFVTLDQNMTTWLNSPFQQGFLTGVQKQMALLGYGFEGPTHLNSNNTIASLKRLRANGIDGIVCLRSPDFDNPATRPYWDNFALVALTRTSPFTQIHSVSTNHQQNLHLAVLRLKEKGASRIALLHHAAVDPLIADHFEAKFLFLARKDPALIKKLCPSALETASAFFQKYKPDALLYPFIWQRNLFHEIQAHLPTDFQSACLTLPDLNCPECGIYQNPEKLGAAAVDSLDLSIKRMELGPRPDARITLIDGQWNDPANPIKQETI